jgi:hypothetical protein
MMMKMPRRGLAGYEGSENAAAAPAVESRKWRRVIEASIGGLLSSDRIPPRAECSIS